MSSNSPHELQDDQEPNAKVPAFNIPTIVVILAAICCGIFVLQEFVLTAEQQWILLRDLSFIPLRYTGPYTLDFHAFTTPVTYAFLHGSTGHLVVNMIWLAAFGSPLAGRIGAVRFLIFWIVTAGFAVLLHFIVHSQDATPVVGASGAISGMMGAAARFGFRIDRSQARSRFNGPVLTIPQVLKSRTVVTFLLVWSMVNLVVGIASASSGAQTIAWEAHIGGFLAGFLLIRLFARNFR
ncbi:rhomboid family intramembrane serine protease [Nitratireductor basaltis]|uniref:Rhomboid family protein n=1 Tax=Nitratireductor basaltis TaxID=472175 RepID=A0A084UAR0_9HYPH|nr:rhomboid family intramembrane serine protease [Nitratireductor basaltis]KFB10046.1 Rhomboid family protein [Nitratireductor basaltis]